MNILQVNTHDVSGGAAQVARALHAGYQARGHSSWLVVGYRASTDPAVLPLPNEEHRSAWTRLVRKWAAAWQSRQYGGAAATRIGEILHARVAQPRQSLRRFLGHEDFDFPGTSALLTLPPNRPDIVHCHNLHGDYFDLRYLHDLSHQAPVTLTLHDAWLLSGHCAHSFGCSRWQTGCGHCPDLTIYPALQRDATAYNWRRKKDLYARSRLHVVTPCRWLMRKVEQSMLVEGLVESQVIANSVDLSTFSPASRETARLALGLPQDRPILLFAAAGIRQNMWKDFATLRAAISRLGAERELLLLALGDNAESETVGHAEIRYIPFQNDAPAVARYYQAADVYVHASRADTFPNAILEAMACGLPVIATAVGGIPEQVDDGKTGFLVPVGADDALAKRVRQLLDDAGLRQQMGEAGAGKAHAIYGLDRQIDAYLTWYERVISAHAHLRNHLPGPGTPRGQVVGVV